MKNSIIFIYLFLLINTSIAQVNKTLSKGVLFINNDFKEIVIYNKNGVEYSKLKKNGDEIKVTYIQPELKNSILNSVMKYYPFYYEEYKKYKIPLPKMSIRAFYPDYSVVVFDAIKTSNSYKVFVNNNWKFIKLDKSMVYETWENYLVKYVYVKSSKNNPLYKDRSLKSVTLNNSSEYSYKVLEVKDDWMKVQCSRECEGCPDNKVLKGWIKWKDGDIILINLYYAC